MNLPRRNNHVLGQPTRAGKTNFVVACLTEIRQACSAIPAGTAEEEAFSNNPVSHSKPTYPLANGHHFSRPLVPRHKRITIEAFWPDTPVQFYITAADTNRARRYQHLIRPRRRQRHVCQPYLAGTLDHDCFHVLHP